MHLKASSPEAAKPKRTTPGIRPRHARSCPAKTKDGVRCKCKPTWEAWVWSVRDQKRIWKAFPTQAAAKKWRAQATSQLDRGERIIGTRITLREAAEAWLEGVQAEPPTILNRSGQPYKPSAAREYERNLRNYVVSELGAVRLSDLRRGDLQRLVDRLLGRGLSPSKVRNIILPVRVIFRHALERDEVTANPTAGLRLPNGHKPRDRAASATEAAQLLAALPEDDRPLWATAFYAGLRRGELMALRWDDVELAAGVIHVDRSWDEKEGEISPKSQKGKRTVPITALLRDYLTEHKTHTRRDGRDFVFGTVADRPFTPSYIRKRAQGAWAAAAVGVFLTGRPLPVYLEPIGLHECRHTFVSLMHDAGLSLERIGDYVGHSSTYMTDRYRHLLEGHEAEAARLLDEYLARADTASRLAQVNAER